MKMAGEDGDGEGDVLKEGTNFSPIDSGLTHLSGDAKIVIQKTMAMLAAAESTMYPMDLLASSASKRVLATIDGFNQLVVTRNLLCSRVLLRVHLDSAVRFSAAWLVADPHKFATDVIGGIEVRKIKDKLGQHMTDRYLVDTRSVDYPWLAEVYRRTSGYVHFSGAHLAATVSRLDDNNGTFQLLIGSDNSSMPDDTWVEMIDCFRELTSFFCEYLEGWTKTKILSHKVSK